MQDLIPLEQLQLLENQRVSAGGGKRNPSEPPHPKRNASLLPHVERSRRKKGFWKNLQVQPTYFKECDSRDQQALLVLTTVRWVERKSGGMVGVCDLICTAPPVDRACKIPLNIALILYDSNYGREALDTLALQVILRKKGLISRKTRTYEHSHCAISLSCSNLYQERHRLTSPMHACPYSRVIVYKRLVAPLSYGKLFHDNLLYLQFISYLRWTSRITRLRADRCNSPSCGQWGSRSQRAARL